MMTKNKTCARLAIFAAAALLALAPFGFAQQKRRAKTTTTRANIWQDVKWEKWGVAYSLPRDLKLTGETPQSNPTRPDGYFGDTREYERSRGGQANASRLALTVDVTNWKGEKIKTDYRGGEIELTPEQLVRLDYIGDTRLRDDPQSPVREASYLEIDGVTGIFVLANAAYDAGKGVNPNNDVRLIWQTHRLYNRNVQRISLVLEGKQKELDAMKKIVASLKFFK